MRGASTNDYFVLPVMSVFRPRPIRPRPMRTRPGAMALDGLGLAGGLIATGARLGCGLGDLRLGPRYRCGLGLNDGRLDLLNLGRFLRGGPCGSLGLIHRGSGNRFRFGSRPMFNLVLDNFFGHTFLLLRTLLRGGLGVAIGTLQQSFLRVEGLLVLFALHGNPGAVTRQAACLYVVAQLHAHVLVHQARQVGSSTGKAISTRCSVLRVIMSAELR